MGYNYVPQAAAATKRFLGATRGYLARAAHRTIPKITTCDEKAQLVERIDAGIFIGRAPLRVQPLLYNRLYDGYGYHHTLQVLGSEFGLARSICLPTVWWLNHRSRLCASAGGLQALF